MAAAEAVGYESMGAERDETYWRLACEAIPRLSALAVREDVPHAVKNKTVPVRKEPRRRRLADDTATLPLVF